MSDFENSIIKRYGEEVNPQFEEGHWDRFLAYRGLQERKRRRWLFWLLLAVIGVSTTYTLSRWQMQYTQGTVTSLPATEEAVATSGSMSSPSRDLTAHEMQGISTRDSEASRLPPPPLLPPSYSAEKSIGKRTSLEHIAEKPEIREFHKDSSGRGTDKPVRCLQSEISVILSDREVSFPTLSPSPSQRGSTDRRFIAQIYSGVSFPFHVETAEEQAHQFGATLHYYLTPQIRVKSGFEFSSLGFASERMEIRLGIRSLQAPSDQVEFSQAIVESLTLNLHGGIDYIWLNTGKWRPWIGAGYSVMKELVKDVDYEFLGHDHDTSEDDFFISESAAANFFVPHILRLEAGIQYEIPLGGLSFSVVYPFQLDAVKLEFLHQVQCNLGILRRF